MLLKLALFAFAFSVQCFVRLAVWALPYRTWRRILACSEPLDQAPRAARATPTQIAWAVTATSRLVPRSTCLVRALTAKMLLSSCGYDSQIRFGVARSDGFQAHAWLEYNGEVLVGVFLPGRYTILDAGVER